MKLWKAYMRMHRKSIFLFGVFSFLFFTVFSLYDLILEPVLYSVILCMIIGALVAFAGFIRFAKKHMLLKAMEERITFELGEARAANNLIEEDYARLLEILFDDKCARESAFSKERKEMLDYYTMWVHQIKTPIAAMGLVLQSQRERRDMDGELLGDLNEMEEQLFKIQQYVAMVLSYLRMGHMSSDLLIKPYSLEDMVKQVIHKYAKSFIRKKIAIELGDLSCMVLTDEKWMVFVLEQLISNGLKYTREGRISIYMEKDRDLTLVIEDTGIGIQPEDIPRIFEKGFTGFNGRSDKKSTGLGLYLCKTIISRLSHTIEIQSQPGEGTRVFIGFSMNEVDFRD